MTAALSSAALSCAAPFAASALGSPLELGVEVLTPSVVRSGLQQFAAQFAPEIAGSLRDRFLTALNRVQAQKYPFGVARDRPLYLFCSDEVNPIHVRDLLVLSEVPRSWEYPVGEREQIAARTDAAWQLLADVDPVLKRVLSAIAGAILFAKQEKYLGGSLSAHVGIIAFTPQDDWSTAEYAGHILHECVHQILFVHDMMFGMFDVRGGIMAEPEALVRSTILQRPRPYDRAFHSAFVAHAITRFWQRIERPDLIPTSPADIITTLDELASKRHLLLPFGLHCLNDLRRCYGLTAV
jgi:HEXXH motif-containing protein